MSLLNICIVILSLYYWHNNIFTEELHVGIEHQFDFISGSQILIKLAYKSNLDEAKELQRQVDELVHKAFVRETMSPCALPVILVPKKDGTWRMWLYSRAINKITIKYLYPILEGLPPFRGIEHPFDFILGSRILNNLDYKSNPEEAKKLQRQVEDLLHKRFLRETMCPCVLPVILVLKTKMGLGICELIIKLYDGRL